ncbi:four-helix bundle copper-binding protein [Parvibaculum sp.]|uniref:four-helix bundle copper-binding protein n=1 Tax=Parvibaculum sp. TaxID=2024848 RepID=UPI003BA92051
MVHLDDLDEPADATPTVVPRRTLLAAASGLAVAAAAAALPGLVPPAAAAPAPASAPHADLVRIALDCSGTGELCLQHCYTELAKGQTMLAQCAARVSEMIPVCEALASLAALESTHLKAYAKVCTDVCKACEEECRKHEAHAAICKQCADSCLEVIAALQRFA